jgi:hypothetical protein
MTVTAIPASQLRYLDTHGDPASDYLALSGICRDRGFDLAIVRGRRRDQRAVDQRRAACVDLRELGWSSTRIGRAIGRDHVTVLWLLGRTARSKLVKRGIMVSK